MPLLAGELSAGRPAHAYLLCCAEPGRLRAAATRLAQAMNCLDGDPRARPCGVCTPCEETARGVFADYTFSPARKIADVRAELARLSERPYAGRLRVLAFAAASEMTREAHNTLLKTLEEPPPAAVLLLLVRNADDVPPTVVSRCRRILLGATPWAVIMERLVAGGVARPRACFAAACSGGDEELARVWGERDDLDETRAAAVQFVVSLIGQRTEAPLEVIERHQERFASGDGAAFWLAAVGCAIEAAIASRGAGQDSLRAGFTGLEWAALGEIDPLPAADLAHRLHLAAGAVQHHAQVRLSLEAAVLGLRVWGNGPGAFGLPQEGAIWCRR